METGHNERESNVNDAAMGGMAPSLRQRLTEAADAMEAGAVPPRLAGLLHGLGYDDENGDRAGRARMLRAAAKLRRIFRISVPDAPGLIFFGGEADPAAIGGLPAGLPVGNLAGSGLTPARAFEACVGEGVEYLSQFLRSDDRLEHSPRRPVGDRHADGFIASVLRFCEVGETQPIAWIPARNLRDDADTWFPLDLCYRRAEDKRNFVPPLKLSTGCAAGPTREAAMLRAVLELIERDAVALWWRGGRRGRPVAGEGAAGRAAAELRSQLRQGATQRRDWLLDITTDLGIPVVAALSASRDGYGLAFGFGARMTLADAARAAIFELCQVELGQHVIAAKLRESGDAALNDSDRRQLRRATLFDTRICQLLQPAGTAAAEAPDISPQPGAALALLVDRLARAGITPYAVDLTRADLAIPVVRVMAPGLQLEPCQITGERLSLAIGETGGGAIHTGGLPLL